VVWNILEEFQLLFGAILNGRRIKKGHDFELGIVPDKGLRPMGEVWGVLWRGRGSHFSFWVSVFLSMHMPHNINHLAVSHP
jgi:hypothetical protein